MAPAIAVSVINPARKYPLGNPIVPIAAKTEGLSSRCGTSVNKIRPALF